MKRVLFVFITLGFTLVSHTMYRRTFEVNGIVYRYPWLHKGKYGCVFDISGRKGDKSYIELDTKADGRDIKVICIPINKDSLLKTLVIPEGYTKVRMFRDFLKLETVVLPFSLSSIEPNAFQGCENIKEFMMPHGNLRFKFKKGNLFRRNGNGLLYSTEGATIPEGTRRIYNGALANRHDTSTIYIPNSVKDIEPNAFGSNSSITDLLFSEDNENFMFKDGNVITKYDSMLVCLLGGEKKINGGVKILRDNLFFLDNNLDSVIVPEGVVRIGSHCFDRCSNLKYIKLPSTLRSIGYNAFEYTQMKSLEIPEGMEHIDCSIGCNDEIESVSIPKSMKKISDYAFSCCSALKVVYLHSKETQIGEHAFREGHNIEFVYK